MRVLLRTGFLLLIVLGLAGQAFRASRGHAGTSALPALVSELARLNVQTTEAAGGRVLLGHSPLCEQPFLAALLSIDGADDGEIQGTSRADFDYRYVHDGVVSDRRSPAVLIGHWVWASIRFQFGLRSTKPSRHMVMVAVPRTCPELMSADWSTLSH